MNSEKRKKTLKLLTELREKFDDSNPDFQRVINEAIEDSIAKEIDLIFNLYSNVLGLISKIEKVRYCNVYNGY